jgi:hypothetical protein
VLLTVRNRKHGALVERQLTRDLRAAAMILQALGLPARAISKALKMPLSATQVALPRRG